MKEVRGGALGKPRTRDVIAAGQAAITPVDTKYAACLQGGRAPSDLAHRSPIIGAHRNRLISRIQNAPDSVDRWALVVTRLARLIDDDEGIGRPPSLPIHAGGGER
jgi:hypothetical protein